MMRGRANLIQSPYFVSRLMSVALFLSVSVPGVSSAEDHRNHGLMVSLQEPAAHEYAARTLRTPTEYAPAAELQMTQETFRRMSRAFVGTLDRSVDFVVLVRDSYEAQALSSEFASIGGSNARLHPVVIAHNSIWYQDYGPIYSFDTDGALISNDFVYSRYNRYADDAVPQSLANLQGIQNRKVSMDYEGGNFISDGRGTCFASSRIYQQNPHLTQERVNALMLANLGCQRMVILAPLVDDTTFHIDLFAKLVADNTFFVGDFVDHPRNKQIMDQNAQILKNLGYTVFRLPVRNPWSANYQSHINSFLINGHAIIPAYGIPEDALAKQAYERLGYRALMVNAADLSGSGGAVHCILRSKPAR